MGKLTNHKSLCGKNQSKIVSQDKESHNPCKHIANNKSRANVAQYQLDGQVFTGHEQRCDFLVQNQDKKTAYLIELKGSNVLHAMEQVLSAEKLLKDDLKDYHVFYRIIYRTRTQEVRQSRIVRWKERCGKSKGVPVVVLKEKILEEDI
ncbi:hypothetical protein [uncultured Mitsuokella sp.]|uniref:hypothetical protein n=1 Tax=uncultured Mitsuokella sp. TaxID=453120 RepID=UPI00266F8B61|nr:hypothetical protein [uncultured Mitsuokella sp.]